MYLPIQIFEVSANQARMYLRWAWDLGFNWPYPSDWKTKRDFAVVLPDNSVRFGLQIADENGEWVVTAFGPICPAGDWDMTINEVKD